MDKETSENLEYIFSYIDILPQEKKQIIDLMEFYAKKQSQSEAVRFNNWIVKNHYIWTMDFGENKILWGKINAKSDESKFTFIIICGQERLKDSRNLNSNQMDKKYQIIYKNRGCGDLTYAEILYIWQQENLVIPFE